MAKRLNWSDNIIRDGFTQSGYIPEVEGLHGAIRFEFRPMLPEETEHFEGIRDRDGARDPKKVRAILGEEVAKRIVSWSEKIDSSPAEISGANVRKMRFTLQTKIYNIISGFSPTTHDPELSTEWDDLQPLESITETVDEQLGK